MGKLRLSYRDEEHIETDNKEKTPVQYGDSFCTMECGPMRMLSHVSQLTYTIYFQYNSI